MNRNIRQANQRLAQPMSKDMMASVTRAQRNDRRTEISMDDVDMGRVMELSKRLYADSEGRQTPYIHPLPYDEISHDTNATLQMVMQAQGLYTFPTQELVDWLHSEIDDDPEYEPHTAIEICAGTGWIGRSLGIPATDSKMQERDDIRQLYLQHNAMPITYPDDVEQLDALAAIRKYEPEYVVASYCTHLYGTGSLKSGNSMGVDTRWVVQHCRRFYHIGNDNIHSRDPIMHRPHRRLQFPWLVTRGDSSKARIYVWENKNY